MKIIEKISEKNKNLNQAKPVTIAFLGDSITQGCFECYYDEKGTLQTVFDTNSSYSTRVKEILNALYPAAQINIINSGISGDTAVGGNNRFERDIAPFNPDMVVVAFGLNDAGQGVANVDKYVNALKNIFEKVKNIGAECVFVFQNMLNTHVSCHLQDDRLKAVAAGFAESQNTGVVDCYYEAAKATVEECGVEFCDIYHAWKTMYEGGVDITELHSNKISHPYKQLHYYIAIKLIEKMFGA